MGGDTTALSELLGTPEQAMVRQAGGRQNSGSPCNSVTLNTSTSSTSPPPPSPAKGRGEPKRVTIMLDPLSPATPTNAGSSPAMSDRDVLRSPVSPAVRLSSPLSTGSSPAMSDSSRQSVKLTKQESTLLVGTRYTACAHKWRNAGGTMGNKPCSHCTKAIWSLKTTMKCALCAMIVHVDCLPMVLANSPNSSLTNTSIAAITPPATQAKDENASPTERSQEGECKMHVIQNVTVMKPTACAHCKELIWGMVKQAYSCKACKKMYHKQCVASASLDRFNTKRLKKAARAEEKKEEKEGRDEATTVLKGLLSDFAKRWSLRRKVALANPVSLVRVAMRHSKQYSHLPRRLPLLKDTRIAQDCAHAMLFAKAVYGVAYANGHLRSVGSTMRMHTVLKPFKDVGNDYSSRENDEGILKSLGEHNTSMREILMSEWSNQVYRPAFALFADHEKRWLVLSVRGTVSDKDTLTDLAAEPAPFLEPGGEAHVGMVKCTESVWSHQLLNERMLENSRKYPDYRVVITGHSLGGAVATLFTILARHDKHGPEWKNRVECFAYGPPPTVNGHVLDKISTNYITSVICGHDLVPRTSLTNLERLAREMAGFKHTELHEGDPHVRMHLPGTLLLIHNPSKKEKMRVHKLPTPPSAAHVHATIENIKPPSSSCRVPQNECTHWVLGMMYVSNKMIGDHLPDRYHNSLDLWSKLSPEAFAERQKKMETERAADASKNKLRTTGENANDSSSSDEDDDDSDSDTDGLSAPSLSAQTSPACRPSVSPRSTGSTPPRVRRTQSDPHSIVIERCPDGSPKTPWKRLTSAFKKKDKSGARTPDPVSPLTPHGGPELPPSRTLVATPEGSMKPLVPKTSGGILSSRSSCGSTTPPPSHALSTSGSNLEAGTSVSSRKEVKRVSILDPSVSSVESVSTRQGSGPPIL